MNRLRDLFTYEDWASRRLLETALRTEGRPERVDVLCTHLLAAQHIWTQRIRGTEPLLKIGEPLPPAQWLNWAQRNIDDIKTLLAEGQTQRIITYRNYRGETYRNSMEDILHHVLLHGAYHRGQIAQLLRPQVDEIPPTDYIQYARISIEEE